MKKIILSAVLGLTLFSTCVASDVRDNNMLLNSGISIENLQIDKSDTVSYATYYWQCEKCGQRMSSGNANYRPPTGYCPATSNHKHIWGRL